MTLEELVAEIKADMGADVITLAISDTTIQMKVKEALRKVGAYTPRQRIQNFNVTGEKLTLPEGTIAVQEVLSTREPVNQADRSSEIDIFSVNNQVLNSSLHDPMSYLMKKNEIDSLMNFVEVTDWYYLAQTRELFLNYYNRSSITIRYIQKYSDISEVESDDVLDVIKRYALSLCKITEGSIRRKLANAPGAMVMDGDALVSEGIAERDLLNEEIPRLFSNFIYGVRA